MEPCASLANAKEERREPINVANAVQLVQKSLVSQVPGATLQFIGDTIAM